MDSRGDTYTAPAAFSMISAAKTGGVEATPPRNALERVYHVVGFAPCSLACSVARPLTPSNRFKRGVTRMPTRLRFRYRLFKGLFVLMLVTAVSAAGEEPGEHRGGADGPPPRPDAPPVATLETSGQGSPIQSC